MRAQQVVAEVRSRGTAQDNRIGEESLARRPYAAPRPPALDGGKKPQGFVRNAQSAYGASDRLFRPRPGEPDYARDDRHRSGVDEQAFESAPPTPPVPPRSFSAVRPL